MTALAPAEGVRADTRLWVAQRASAAVLALCVAVHLALIIYAVRRGLSAADILGRTHGSIAWVGFYLLFVAAVSVHAPIGVRAIVREMTAWRGRSLDVASVLFAALLAWLGVRAVWGLFA